MDDPKAPQGGELSVEQLYSKKPIDAPLNEIYAVPGIQYHKETADSFRPLFQSVLKEGIREPVELVPRREGGYYLAHGYRRCHAAVAAHLRTIPARTRRCNRSARKPPQSIFQGRPARRPRRKPRLPPKGRSPSP